MIFPYGSLIFILVRPSNCPYLLVIKCILSISTSFYCVVWTTDSEIVRKRADKGVVYGLQFWPMTE